MNDHDWEVLTNLHSDLLNYAVDWEIEDEKLKWLVKSVFDSVDDFKLEMEEKEEEE